MNDISVLDYALAAMDIVHAGEANSIRSWASQLMTDAIESHQRTIPLRYQEAHLGMLDDDQSPGRIRDWLLNPQAQTLFLVGETGTGKTTAAWAAYTQSVIDAVVAASRGEFVTPPACGIIPVPDLLDGLRHEGRLPEAWTSLRTSPLLGLDDLGAARPTPWALEKLWSLTNARSSDGLKTIVTTNSDWSTLVETWGEPMMDRLRDRSMTVTMVGASRRVLINA